MTRLNRLVLGLAALCALQATAQGLPAEVEAALHAKATIVFQEYCCEKTSKYIATKGQEVVVLNAPCGVDGTAILWWGTRARPDQPARANSWQEITVLPSGHCRMLWRTKAAGR